MSSEQGNTVIVWTFWNSLASFAELQLNEWIKLLFITVHVSMRLGIIQLYCLVWLLWLLATLNEDRVRHFQVVSCINYDHKTISKMFFFCTEEENAICMQKLKRNEREIEIETKNVGKQVLSLYITHWPNFYQQCDFNQVFLDAYRRLFLHVSISIRT